ncbi:MAG: hypothetical protein ACTHLW_16530, partial [Verrucomicrobiota bacterium]
MKNMTDQAVSASRWISRLACYGLLLAAIPSHASLLLQYTFDDSTNTSFTLDGSSNPTNGFFSGQATRTPSGSSPSGTGYALNVLGGNSAGSNYISRRTCAKLSTAKGS